MKFATQGIRPLLVLGFALIALWPLVFSTSYDLRVFTLAGIYALLVIGFHFIFGHAGALALTQGTFFGLGAYIAALLALKLGWPAQWTLACAILGPVLLALIVAAPVLRLESHYFALATLGIGQVVWLLAISWESFTGGANGLPGVPNLVMFGEPIARGWPLALLVWLCVAVGAVIAWQIGRRLIGRAYTLMRENDIAAVSVGIDIWRMRFIAFLVSAAYGGLAGGLFVYALRVISPEVLEFHVMVACLTMLVVGGRTSVAGAILGAFLLVHLPEWFRGMKEYYLIVYGLVLLAMIILAPEGLIGLAHNLRARLRPESTAPPQAIPLPVQPAVVVSFALLEVEQLSISFGGVRALDDVSFAVSTGEIFGLIGPNGSGKTTLVNCVTGLYRRGSGRIRIAGKDITQLAPYMIARRGIARTFQSINLVDAMTVLDNVAVARFAVDGSGFARAALAPYDDTLARARGHAMHLLQRLDCGAVAMQSAIGLPHGVRRRVEIARALATQPKLVLLDEPAAGLTESEQKDLARHIRVLAAQGIAILVIEHNMPFLMALANRIACLNHGRLIALGTPDAIRTNPAVINAYLGGSVSSLSPARPQ